MSIIHNALKKVQERLTPKIDESTPLSSEKPSESSNYIYANTSSTEPETPVAPKMTVQKPTKENKLKSALALICAITITVGSFWYIYQQFKSDIPIAQRLTKKWFYKLIKKEETPEFKSKKSQDLKPLARITIPLTISPSSNPNPVGTTTTNITQPSSPSPITLNVHGIMSSGGSNVALINDQVYQEGDEIEGAKIIKINLNSIKISIDGKEKTIFVDN